MDGEGIEMEDLSYHQDSTDPVERDSAESLAVHDPTHVQLTLQVLGLMCDGQNRTLQVYDYHFLLKIAVFLSQCMQICHSSVWQESPFVSTPLGTFLPQFEPHCCLHTAVL